MATLSIRTDKASYAVGEDITVTLTVDGLAPGEDGWERVAELVGTLTLSDGGTVEAAGPVTVTKAARPPQTASNPVVTSDAMTFTLLSFDGTTAVLRGTAA